MMRRVIQWLPAFALTIGPCAAYLVWAITRRKLVHTGLALLLNIGFWIAGPALLAAGLHNLM